MVVGDAAGDVMYFRGTDGIPFTISVFTAITDGLYQRLDQNAVATANSPDNAIIRKNCHLVDYVANGITTAETGKIELVSNGMRTQIMIDLSSQAPTNAGRPVLGIPVAAGTELRLLAASTLA